MDVLLHLPDVGHQLGVAAVDVYLDVVLAHAFNQNKVPDACPVAWDASRLFWQIHL